MDPIPSPSLSAAAPLSVPAKEILPVFDPSRAFVRLSPAERTSLGADHYFYVSSIFFFSPETIVALWVFLPAPSKTCCHKSFVQK